MLGRWLLGILALSTTGCATLFSGTSEPVTFTSEPAGAEVVLDGDRIGVTPLTYEMDRETFRHSTVVLRKPGYKSEKFAVRKTLNTVALFNCTSVLSWGTDALTGAMMEYSPSKYFVELTPQKGKASTAHRQALSFVLISHRSLSRAIARGHGAELATVAQLFGVSDADKPRFLSVIEEAAPRLVHYEHPHELYRALSHTLAQAGWSPVDCGCDRFEADTTLGFVSQPQPLSLDVQRWVFVTNDAR